jgi:hypothetical protein
VTLEQAIAALTRAGFDVNVTTLCDALWLAMHPNLTVGATPTRVSTSQDNATRRAEQPTHPPNRPLTATGANPSPEQQEMQSSGQTSVYQGDGEFTGDSVKASPIRVPAGAALPGRLPLLRSLRPFTERWPSQFVEELDEEATVDSTAEQGGRLGIVLRSRPERWYEAALVVEDSPSMDVWHETLHEFELLLLESGAFRDVRMWRLGFVPSKGAPGKIEPELRAGVNSSGSHMSPGGLASRGARRLIFLATHGISPRWADASMGCVLEAWSQEASVVILHMLPPSLWARTTLGEPGGLAYALVPGARTAQLAFERFSWDYLEEERPSVAIPVIPLEPEACANWGQMQMARGRRAPVMLVPKEATSNSVAVDDERLPSDERLVALFRSHGSRLAFRLAVYLSPGPFTLPVARLI